MTLLVVLSGCSVLAPGSPSATPTATPTATPEPATAVPGVENDTLTNASALVDGHVAAVDETGFETDQQTNGTQEVQGDVKPSSRRTRTLVEPGAAEYRYRIANREAGSRFDFWGNRSLQVVRTRVHGETRSVQVLNRTANVSLLARADLLETYLGASTFTVRSRTVRNGTTFVTLTADATHAPEAVSPENATNVSNYTAEVVVDTRGRIHSMDVTADYTHDGEAYEFEVTYRLLQVDVDDEEVTRPDWADRALEEQ